MKKKIIGGIVIAAVLFVEGVIITRAVDPIAYIPFIFLFILLDGILLVISNPILKLLEKRKNIKHIIQSFLISLTLLLVTIGLFSIVTPTVRGIKHQFVDRSQIDSPNQINAKGNFICMHRGFEYNLEELSPCNFQNFIHKSGEEIYFLLLISAFLTALCILTYPYLILWTILFYKKTNGIDFKQNKKLYFDLFTRFVIITFGILLFFYFFSYWSVLEHLFIKIG